MGLLATAVDNAVDPDGVVELPTKIKSLVSALNDLSFEIRTLMREAPPEILATDLIIQQAWAVREYGGRERTIFAIATARKQPMSNDDLIYMKENHGRAAQAWSLIEQNRDNPLLSAKNVVITPHIAWAAKEARIRLMATTAQNIAAFGAGKPINVVNASA